MARRSARGTPIGGEFVFRRLDSPIKLIDRLQGFLPKEAHLRAGTVPRLLLDPRVLL